MADLSIVIPARNEMFLGKTVESILQNIEGDTEVIVVLDGTWADPPIADNPRVTILHFPTSIGQRAATNRGVSLSKAKYIMKCDAHCSFDKGFDVKMMGQMHDDWTMVPLMKNLHAFDWICPEDHRRYQGPSGPCQTCGKPTIRDIMWQAKPSPNSTSYCFDSEPHFQYFRDYAKRPEAQGEITETMSLQGSSWMLTRDKYWELNVCDEAFGSWGSQGIEVAVKTWLSGGQVMVNKKTWYAHMFRTQGGDFGFPYPISGSDQEKAKSFARDLFFNDKWPLQKKPLSWLVEKFWPVPGWTQADLDKLKANTFSFSEIPKASSGEIEPVESEAPPSLLYEAGNARDVGKKYTKGILSDSSRKNAQPPTKGILYFTDHMLKLGIAFRVQRNLREIGREKGIPITSVSLKPMPNFGNNICLGCLGISPNEADVATQEILVGLKNIKADIIFICANDVLYNSSHFDFDPPEKNKVYYNRNWWRLRTTDGLAVHWEGNEIGLCGFRDDLIRFFKKSDNPFIVPSSWKSTLPNVDIKNEGNYKKYPWSLTEFTTYPPRKSFQSSDEIPGWGKTKDLIRKLV